MVESIEISRFLMIKLIEKAEKPFEMETFIPAKMFVPFQMAFGPVLNGKII